MRDNADASVESLFVRKLLSGLKKTNQTPYLMYHAVYMCYSTHEKKIAVNPSRQGAKLIKSIYMYINDGIRHHKNQLKSYEWNLLFSTLCCWIYGSILITMNRARSALTHSECQEREENSSWYDGLGPKWPQYSIQEKSKCSWQFILTHDRTSRQWRPRAPDLKKKKEINKQNNKKKTLDGQHKCYEIYEKSYFLYFIKKKEK